MISIDSIGSICNFFIKKHIKLAVASRGLILNKHDDKQNIRTRHGRSKSDSPTHKQMGLGFIQVGKEQQLDARGGPYGEGYTKLEEG